MTKPEGTYMLWLNCHGLNMNREQLEKFMLYEAKIAQHGYQVANLDGGFLTYNSMFA